MREAELFLFCHVLLAPSKLVFQGSSRAVHENACVFDKYEEWFWESIPASISTEREIKLIRALEVVLPTSVMHLRKPFYCYTVEYDFRVCSRYSAAIGRDTTAKSMDYMGFCVAISSNSIIVLVCEVFEQLVETWKINGMSVQVWRHWTVESQSPSQSTDTVLSHRGLEACFALLMPWAADGSEIQKILIMWVCRPCGSSSMLDL